MEGRKIDVEIAVCDLCERDNANIISECHDMQHIVNGTFQVAYCGNCGHYFLKKRPISEDIGLCYPENYYSYSMSSSIKSKINLKKLIKNKIRSNRLLSELALQFYFTKRLAIDEPFINDIDEWIPIGNVLDIGCGDGAFLDLMKQANWNTFGLEPNQKAANIAKKKGHIIFQQRADANFDATFYTNQFHIIYMSHVLEHTHSPTRTLMELSKVLEPSGKIIIEVPNMESLSTILFEEFSPCYDIPRHLHFFTPETIKKYMDKCGLQIISLRCFTNPIQFTRAIDILVKNYHSYYFRNKAKSLLSNLEIIKSFSGLAEFADQIGYPGTIRLVAERSQ